jgi:hypothetical protein
MAYIAAAALVTRLREVLEESKGVLRTVPAGRFAGDLFEGLSEAEQMRRAFTTARVRADVSVLGRSKYCPSQPSNLLIYDITVSVTALRTITRKDQLSQDENDELAALFNEDTDVIRQALEDPRNLLTTESGTPTGLLSGLLLFKERSGTNVIRLINQGAQKYEQKITFTGFLKCAPATA